MSMTPKVHVRAIQLPSRPQGIAILWLVENLGTGHWSEGSPVRRVSGQGHWCEKSVNCVEQQV